MMININKDISLITDGQRLTKQERIIKETKYKLIQKIFNNCVRDNYSNINWVLANNFKDNYATYMEDIELINDFLKFIGANIPLREFKEPINFNYKKYIKED